jgi:hypothetical protein
MQLCSAHLAASHHFDMIQARAMYREDAFHTLVLYKPPHSEGFFRPRTLSGDADAGEVLDSPSVTFLYSHSHLHGIAGPKLGYLFAGVFILDGLE